MWHISLVPVFNRKALGNVLMAGSMNYHTAKSRKTLSAKSTQMQNSIAFLFVTLWWTGSQEHLSTAVLPVLFTIQIFLAWKLKSRNICQTYIPHFLFVEFLLFTEIFSYRSHQIKERCTHHLPLVTYTIPGMNNHLKMHWLNKINKPAKFVIR